MALVIGQTFRLLHFPRCGGNWCCGALWNATRDICIQDRVIHYPLMSAPGRGLRTFVFVRDPATWIKSYWAFRMWKGWWKDGPWDRECNDVVFADYIEKLLAHEKWCGLHDYYTTIYTQDPKNNQQVIPLCFDFLAEELAWMLQLTKQPHAPEKIEWPRQYANDYKRFPAEWRDEEQKQRWLAANPFAVEAHQFAKDNAAKRYGGQDGDNLESDESEHEPVEAAGPREA